MLVYHFIGQNFGLDDIRRRRLKIAKIDELNDPFELLAASSPDSEVRRAFKETKDKIALSRGILCFSRRSTNPIQWSHYADKHRGLCLGFEIPDEMLMPVTYSPRRLNVDLAKLRGFGPAAEAEMQRILCTKYSHWRYEKEVRCFVSLEDKDEETGRYFCPFSAQLKLRSVIVGHNSVLSRGALAEALGKLSSSVTVCKARLAFGSFKVVRQRKETLWT